MWQIFPELGSYNWVNSSGYSQMVYVTKDGIVLYMNSEIECRVNDKEEFQGAWWLPISIPSNPTFHTRM